VGFCKGNGRLYRDDLKVRRRIWDRHSCQALICLALTNTYALQLMMWSCLSAVWHFLMMSDPVEDDAIPYGCTVVNVIFCQRNTTHKILSPSNFQKFDRILSCFDL
jgi:hypothetical protein